MCGILGIIHFSKKDVIKNDIDKALDYLHHRGPDYRATHVDRFFAFGHTRLSIVDLQERSNQPFFSEDQRYILVFNGEIYNYKSLRAKLEKKGVLFHTASDTEVLLKGYMEEGAAFINSCEGIFSLGIWDKVAEKLFLCRDRFGVKPLYYFMDSDKIVFSSEIKPILYLLKNYEIDTSVLSHFVRFRYHPGNETSFKGIVHLPMGTWMKIDKGQVEKIHQYWSVDQFTSSLKINKTEALEQFSQKLQHSVQSQMTSEVSSGVFLSGGVDSASVFSLVNNLSPGTKAFTLGLRTKDDEIDLARTICESRGGVFKSSLIDNEDFGTYKKSLWHLEEPLADSILSATFHLAEFASKDATVVFSGEGADEILGGYIHHQFLSVEEKLMKAHLSGAFSFLLKFAPLSLVQKLFPYKAKLGIKGLEKLRSQVEYIGQWGMAYEKTGELFEEDFLMTPQTSSLWQDLWDKNPLSEDFLNTLTRFDLKHWNSKYTLLRLDKLTMAHGLEARVPFLDSELAAFSLSLPQNYKLRKNENKWILRESMKNSKVLNASEAFRKKQAFFLPIEKTYGKKFIEFAADTLLSKKSLNRGMINRERLTNLIDDNYSDLLPGKQLMSLLIHELWCELYMDGEWKKIP